MRLLVVGGGGREHALCLALRLENPDADIFCAPGNPGTAAIATNLPIAADDVDRIADAADMYGVALTIVGPEAPLARGLADRLRAEGRAVFGPSAAAAQLEASKAFSKDVMAAAGVPTAASGTFADLTAAIAFIDRQEEPLVVKASGLAAGKGAVVCPTRIEARRVATSMLREGTFGDAGRVIVVEAFLGGEELSVLALTDGTEVELLVPAQDHKRLFDGDNGPNTGGMGAYAPVSIASAPLLDRVRDRVLGPTLAQMHRQGTPFQGVLYAGLMIDGAGEPSVVEFNCRLGDPEAQVVLPLVEGGLTDCLESIAGGRGVRALRSRRQSAVTTVLAAYGYPDAPLKGAAISIPDDLPPAVTVYHAGTSADDDGILRVNGGRVLAVTAVANRFADAQALSRDAAERIEFDGKQFRHDIGWREAGRRGEDAR